jgi:hypothetical protein
LVPGVTLLLSSLATWALQAFLLRRRKEKSGCGAIHLQIEGKKATPIDFDMNYRVFLDDLDGLEDFGAV